MRNTLKLDINLWDAETACLPLDAEAALLRIINHTVRFETTGVPVSSMPSILRCHTNKCRVIMDTLEASGFIQTYSYGDELEPHYELTRSCLVAMANSLNIGGTE